MMAHLNMLFPILYILIGAAAALFITQWIIWFKAYRAFWKSDRAFWQMAERNTLDHIRISSNIASDKEKFDRQRKKKQKEFQKID